MGEINERRWLNFRGMTLGEWGLALLHLPNRWTHSCILLASLSLSLSLPFNYRFHPVHFWQLTKKHIETVLHRLFYAPHERCSFWHKRYTIYSMSFYWYELNASLAKLQSKNIGMTRNTKRTRAFIRTFCVEQPNAFHLPLENAHINSKTGREKKL